MDFCDTYTQCKCLMYVVGVSDRGMLHVIIANVN